MKYLFVLAVIVVCSCQTPPPPSGSAATYDEAVTKKVLDHHWETFKGNDLEGVMADYTEESILITPDKTYSGLAEIRVNFESAFGLFPKDSTAMELKKSVIQKDVGYIIWTASGPKLELSFGTDTFIIRDGKILRQTFGGVASAPQ